MICPACGSSHVNKKGYYYHRKTKKANSIRYRCMNCKKQWNESLKHWENSNSLYKDDSMPKILLMDIETSLYHVATWGTYKQYINHYQITKNQFVLSWAAKYLYDDNVDGMIVTSKEAKNRDDERVIHGIWKLLDDADIVIGHNAERFDLRKLKWRFISLDMEPPSPYRVIDTLNVSRKEFFSPSHKQDYLTKYFKLQNKLDTDFKLWVDCEAGDKTALDKMLDYNKHDVIGLEQLYLKVRPYIRNHPNLAVMVDDDACPNCGGIHLEETDKFYYTTANRFPVYRCMSCGTPYIRSKKNTNTNSINYRSVPK